jgi:hypothetical protein
MSHTHDILIPYPEPETRSHPWFFLLVGFILICLLFMPPLSRGVSVDYQEDPNVTSWLSKEKARDLMRYHGTNGIMITEDRVYIKRDSRWICVYRNPAALSEGEDRQDTPMTAVGVPGGRS